VPVSVTRRSALLPPPPPAPSVLALFYSADSGLAFPFGLTTVSVKNILAGYAALQHIALGVLGHDNSSPRRTELTLTSTDENKMRRCVTWLTRTGQSGSSIWESSTEYVYS